MLQFQRGRLQLSGLGLGADLGDVRVRGLPGSSSKVLSATIAGSSVMGLPSVASNSTPMQLSIRISGAGMHLLSNRPMFDFKPAHGEVAWIPSRERSVYGMRCRGDQTVCLR